MSAPLPRPARTVTPAHELASAPGPQSAAGAVAMVLAGLGWLASADLAAVPVTAQADALRGLERALSVHTAARARVLGAFAGQRGFENDGQGSPRTWLAWQTRITRPAASAALAWTRRLAAHPAVSQALAAAEISVSWARQICEWTDLLPAEHRSDADAILLAAAAGGADLDDLAALAAEMRARLAGPDRDQGGFEDRSLRLDITLGGAGRLTGDLTPRCAAALQALLDALGKRAGPEDIRSTDQRHHDALEEACRRLIAAGGLPDRAGQPTRIQLHIGVDDLIGRITAAAGQAAGPTIPATTSVSTPVTGPGPAPWPAMWPAAAPGDDCDATIAPIVTGRVDHDLLDRLAATLTSPGRLTITSPCTARCAAADTGCTCDSAQARNRAAARELLLANAIALLSGPGGLASVLRTGTLPGPAGSISLPLDVGAATDTIPPHLRRAVIRRDRHCRFPGCDQPPAACQVHHIKPRSQGGQTKLTNLGLLCAFHHLIAVHQWGWIFRLNPDGTTTATSPYGRTLHSHSPPATAA